MRAFFKDTDKIVINSMDHSEALVGKQFLSNLQGKVLDVEQRNDINDDFDGLVLKITDIVIPEPEINYVGLEYKLVKNDTTDLELTFSVYLDNVNEEYIMVDYDKDYMNQFFKFLTDIGCTDIKFSPTTGLQAKTNGNIVTAMYTLPKGIFTFHLVGDNRIFQNDLKRVEFEEVVQDSGVEE